MAPSSIRFVRLTHRVLRRRGAVALACASVLAIAVAAAHPGPSAASAHSFAGNRYIEPITGGIIIDHFRPPPTPYAAGNRGVDERVPALTPVVASADGEVLFAGDVAGTLHVTVGHADGLRTSYSFIVVVFVHRGQHVEQGTPIGLSGVLVHFGVRDPSGTYLDPEALWAGQLGARLVPGPDEGASSPALIADESQVVAGEVWARRRGPGADRFMALAIETASLAPAADLASLSRELLGWGAGQAACTSAVVPVPAATGRRLAILVGGLGSSSGSAAVDRVDLSGLGYRPADVVRFSYRGGRAPDGRGDHGRLDAIELADYAPSDTVGDLRAAGQRLRDLIAAVHHEEPGVPLDVIAHSQGGVIARIAIGSGAGEVSTPSDPGHRVDTLVTLATPHQGAELATAVTGLGGLTGVGGLVDRLGEVTGLPANAPAVAELSQGSAVIAELTRPVPPGVRVLSIGASGDLTVPAARTSIPGATNVVVHLGGLHAHDQLPGQASVTREIGLARAGLAPTCVSWVQGVSDVLMAHGIARGEATVGLATARVLGP